MKSFAAFCIFTAGLLIVFSNASAADRGQLYGKIRTVDRETYEGFIRWDKNEAFWDDILDGNKELDRKRHARYPRRDDYRRRREISIFGVTIFRDDGDMNWGWSGNEAQSGIRMGHIQKLVPEGDDKALLILKSGTEVELKGGSGDIGTDNREILVDDTEEGIIELYWDDIDEIEFMPTPKRESQFGTRLYGTITTRRAGEYTGFICWDKDESFNLDIIDGREDRRKRKIEFEKIKSIERHSSQSSIVTLKNGNEMRLDDSNDIDSGNRGIEISDTKLGRILVDWDEFDRADFTEPPPSPSYEDFDGGRRIHGTVYTEDGDKFTGDIKWDDDEEYTWEILDGDYRGISFDIEFAFIKSIEKMSRHGSEVTLTDGRVFNLRDSNDIDSDNKGIIVYTDKDEIYIDWEDFAKADFSY